MKPKAIALAVSSVILGATLTVSDSPAFLFGQTDRAELEQVTPAKSAKTAEQSIQSDGSDVANQLPGLAGMTLAGAAVTGEHLFSDLDAQALKNENATAAQRVAAAKARMTRAVQVLAENGGLQPVELLVAYRGHADAAEIERISTLR